MRAGRGKKVGPKKVNMPQVEFNLKAIKEIKKRKKEVCKGDSKQSEKRR
jgi:hypothetical protein